MGMDPPGASRFLPAISNVFAPFLLARLRQIGWGFFLGTSMAAA